MRSAYVSERTAYTAPSLCTRECNLVHTARKSFTDECTKIVHLRCSVLHSHPVCEFCSFCTAITHWAVKIALLADELHAWSALSVKHVRQKYIAVPKICCNPQFISHRNALLVQKDACVAHCWYKPLRIAAIFWHSDRPLRALTMRVATNGVTYGDHHS